jgi:hypothetical protein
MTPARTLGGEDRAAVGSGWLTSTPSSASTSAAASFRPERKRAGVQLRKNRLAPAVASALESQLGERLQFVHPPAPVVADLLFDWANLSIVSGKLETAEALYRQGLAFGMTNRPLAQQRLVNVQRLLKTYTKRAK